MATSSLNTPASWAEAARLAVSVGPFTALGQGQKSECASGKAGGGGGLGTLNTMGDWWKGEKVLALLIAAIAGCLDGSFRGDGQGFIIEIASPELCATALPSAGSLPSGDPVARRFPPPSSVEGLDPCFLVRKKYSGQDRPMGPYWAKQPAAHSIFREQA